MICFSLPAVMKKYQRMWNTRIKAGQVSVYLFRPTFWLCISLHQCKITSCVHMKSSFSSWQMFSSLVLLELSRLGELLVERKGVRGERGSFIYFFHTVLCEFLRLPCPCNIRNLDIFMEYSQVVLLPVKCNLFGVFFLLI